MKKIIFSLLLLFTFTYAETPIQSDVGKWRRFFGVEAGVGKMDIYLAFLLSFIFFDLDRLTGASYGGGILGGWQKYTYEKVGMRNTLGLRVFGAKDTKAKGADYKQYEGELIIDSTFYYALDGLFDFVKNGDNRFGMSFGASTDLLQITKSQNLFGIEWILHLAPRVGFYAQFDHHLFDFIFSVPLIGVGLFPIAYNSTLTLGYKYLFSL